jgi:PTH2 family peptidyl-tRNA hydrolase
MPVQPNMYDDEALVSIRKNQEDPIIQYFIYNKDAKNYKGNPLSTGKISAQCAHAAQMMLLRYFEFKKQGTNQDKVELVEKWMQESFRKVVLKAKKKDFDKVKEDLDCFLVRDAGLTEVDPGTETFLSLFPMRKSDVPDIIKKLQCL